MDEADMIVMVSPRACGVYAAAILEKPFIVLHPAPLPAIGSFAQVPLPPSYVAMNGRQSSDEMSFLERTSNFLSFQIKDIVVDWLVTYYYREIQAKFDWETNESFVKLFGKAELYIVSVDFAFEFAHPLMPNVFYVGPILPKPPAILPPDLETFMQSSRDNGVVVISFGSAINSLSRTIIDRMLLAISQLKQKVVWKIKLAADAQIPPNLKVVDWLPQNDLIGHAKTKAFVSHMGANGAAEAAYHGVPLVAACIMSDSFYNTVRFVKKVKMAKLIDVYNADADTWKNTIEEVINNSSYKDNAMKASKLIRSWPKSSLEQAGDLIQYALDNGGRLPHLKSNAHKLYWFQYHCVDVVAFLLFFFIATLFILYRTFKLLLYLLLGYKSKSKTE